MEAKLSFKDSLALACKFFKATNCSFKYLQFQCSIQCFDILSIYNVHHQWVIKNHLSCRWYSDQQKILHLPLFNLGITCCGWVSDIVVGSCRVLERNWPSRGGSIATRNIANTLPGQTISGNNQIVNNSDSAMRIWWNINFSGKKDTSTIQICLTVKFYLNILIKMKKNSATWFCKYMINDSDVNKSFNLFIYSV